MPADAAEHRRGAFFFREGIEFADGGALVPHVAEQNVRRQFGAVEIEGLEALALPLLGGAEMDQAPQTGGPALLDDHLAGGDPLQAVDDVGRVAQVDGAVGARVEVIATHAEFDVGQHLASLHDGGQLIDLRLRQDFPLVAGDHQMLEGFRIDHPAKDDFAVVPRVERDGDDVNDLIFVGHVPLLVLTLSSVLLPIGEHTYITWNVT